MREKLQNILLVISWRQFARQYFGKSSSWLYHKIDGIDKITDDELLQFKKSLLSLSEELKATADRL